jgi:hypothetical protein
MVDLFSTGDTSAMTPQLNDVHAEVKELQMKQVYLSSNTIAAFTIHIRLLEHTPFVFAI